MANYVAVYGSSDSRIMTVMADNTESAILEVTRQLSRPGRWGVLRVWQEHGSRVIEGQAQAPKLETPQERARPRERWER